MIRQRPRYFVFGQREWEGSHWHAIAYLPTSDEEYVAMGFKLVGWVRDSIYLSDVELARVFELAAIRELKKKPLLEQELKELLARCPFTSHRLPFVDLDVSKTPTQDAALLAADYARALAVTLPKHGLGNPSWAISNRRGGLHGRVSPPARPVEHFNLPEVFQELLQGAAREAGVPLLSELPEKKAQDRAAQVFLDDSFFVAGPRSRGRQWRLVKIPKDKPDSVYWPAYLPGEGLLVPLPLEHWSNGGPIDEVAILEKAKVLDEQAQADARARAETEAAREKAQAALVKTHQPNADRFGTWNESWTAATRRGLLLEVQNAPAGQRNDTLNRVAYRAGTLVAGGAFDDSIESELEQAALSDPEAIRGKIQDTLRRGFQAGLLRPQKPTPPLDALEDAVQQARVRLPESLDLREAAELIAKAKRPTETPRVQDWLEKNAKDPYQREQLLRALVAELLKLQFPEDFVVKIASGIEETNAAWARVRSTSLRIQSGGKVRSAYWIHQTFGKGAILELMHALNADAGPGVRKKTSELTAMLRAGLVRGEEAQWRTQLHDSLHPDDPARGGLITPTGCCRYGDKIYADGRYVCTTKKRCGRVGCTPCFLIRLSWEAKLLTEGWEDIDGERVEGWSARGPFWVWKLELPSREAVEDTEERVKRYVHFPKVKVHTFLNGRPGLVYVTNSSDTAAAIAGELWHMADKHGGKLVTKKTEDAQEVLDEVTLARVALHTYESDLVRERKGPDLITWHRWLKGRHLVTKTPKKGLPFPTREELRIARRDPENDPFPAEYLNLTYVATDLDTDTPLHTSEHPHTLQHMVYLAQNSPKLQRLKEALDHDLNDHAWQEYQERAFREGERERREAALVGSAAPAFSPG